MIYSCGTSYCPSFAIHGDLLGAFVWELSPFDQRHLGDQIHERYGAVQDYTTRAVWRGLGR